MSKSGISLPRPAFRFRVMPDIRQELQSLFAQEVSNAILDLKNNELKVKVRHSHATGILETVWQALEARTIRLDLLDGGTEVSQSFSTLGTKIESHELVFDYANSGFLVHNIVWKFDDLEEWNKPALKPKEMPMVKVEGLVGIEEAVKLYEDSKKKTDKSE